MLSPSHHPHPLLLLLLLTLVSFFLVSFFLVSFSFLSDTIRVISPLDSAVGSCPRSTSPSPSSSDASGGAPTYRTRWGTFGGMDGWGRGGGGVGMNEVDWNLHNMYSSISQCTRVRQSLFSISRNTTSAHSSHSSPASPSATLLASPRVTT